MIKHIYDETGMKLIRTEEATPKCGDFCDTCGDCLHCYGDYDCLDVSEHFWVQYGEEPTTPNDKGDVK